ncbi:MAG: hypothetical protein AB7G21_05330 [Dehalococcoidia bacterium]
MEATTQDETRWVSLDIGPFADQGELLQFALLLEQAPGVGQLDLLDADPETARFAVRYRSASELATALTRLPDYRIKPIALANMVSAEIEDPRRPALLILPAAAGGAWWTGRWWARMAGAVGAVAAAAGIFYFALSGDTPAFTPEPARTATPAVVASAPAVPTVATPAAPAPVASATPSPTATVVPAVPAATPAATASATPVVTPSPTATPSPTPIPIVTARYSGPFTAGLGIIRAANGCRWQVNITGNLAMSLTPDANGRSGPASMDGNVEYEVYETPANATCNPLVAPISASGTASGNGTINASLTGDRGLSITAALAAQGNSLAGNLWLERTLTTVSSFGNTTEVRSGTAPAISLSRID